ncbi:MAG: hypothetical protein AAFZ91_03385 [Pseudomonadota bacterium]
MKKLSLLTAGCLLLTVGAVASPAPTDTFEADEAATLSETLTELGYADIAAENMFDREALITPAVEGADTVMKLQRVDGIPGNCNIVWPDPCVMVCTPGGLQLCEDPDG